MFVLVGKFKNLNGFQDNTKNIVLVFTYMTNKLVPAILLLVILSIIVASLALPIYSRFIFDFSISVLLIIFIFIPSALYLLYRTVKNIPVINIIKPIMFIASLIVISVLIGKLIKPIESLAASQFYRHHKDQIANIIEYSKQNDIYYAIKNEESYDLFRSNKERIQNDKFKNMLQEIELYSFLHDDSAIFINLYNDKNFMCFGLGFAKIRSPSNWRLHPELCGPVNDVCDVENDFKYYYFID